MVQVDSRNYNFHGMWHLILSLLYCWHGTG